MKRAALLIAGILLIIAAYYAAIPPGRSMDVDSPGDRLGFALGLTMLAGAFACFAARARVPVLTAFEYFMQHGVGARTSATFAENAWHWQLIGEVDTHTGVRDQALALGRASTCALAHQEAASKARALGLHLRGGDESTGYTYGCPAGNG